MVERETSLVEDLQKLAVMPLGFVSINVAREPRFDSLSASQLDLAPALSTGHLHGPSSICHSHQDEDRVMGIFRI